MFKSLLAYAAFVLPFSSSSVIPNSINLKEYFAHPKDLHHRLSSRIIGGEEVIPYSYPFQAAIFIVKGEDVFLCGGTLISNQWVLTAAHCVDLEPDYFYVVLGIHNLNDLDTDTAQVATESVFPENWGEGENLFQDDIGLIKLPQNVTYSEFIQPVRLANGTDQFDGDNGTITGWGQTEDGNLSGVLRRVNSTVLSNEECARANSAYEQVIVDSHICLSGAGTVGICNGDSGGPLLVNGTQVGIASFGTVDCLLGLPSVFTRVTEFYDWVVEQTGDLSS